MFVPCLPQRKSVESADGKESTDGTVEEKEEEWQEAHKSHSHAQVAGSFSGTPAALHAKEADIFNIVFSAKLLCNVVLFLNITCAMATSLVCPGYCEEEAAKTPQPVGSTSRRTIEQVGKTRAQGLHRSMYSCGSVSSHLWDHICSEDRP